MTTGDVFQNITLEAYTSIKEACRRGRQATWPPAPYHRTDADLRQASLYMAREQAAAWAAGVETPPHVDPNGAYVVRFDFERGRYVAAPADER